MLDTILEVSFTADQKHLLAAGGDQALRMWDIASGRVRHTLTGHTGKVLSIPFHMCPQFKTGFTCPQALFREELHCKTDIVLARCSPHLPYFLTLLPV